MRHLSRKKGKIDFFELREMRSFPFECFSVSLRRRSEQIYLSFLKDFHCPTTTLAAFFRVLFVVGVFVFVHALVGIAKGETKIAAGFVVIVADCEAQPVSSTAR